MNRRDERDGGDSPSLARGVAIHQIRCISLYRCIMYRCVSLCIDTERCIADSEACEHATVTIHCIGLMYRDVSCCIGLRYIGYITKRDTSKAIHTNGLLLVEMMPSEATFCLTTHEKLLTVGRKCYPDTRGSSSYANQPSSAPRQE